MSDLERDLRAMLRERAGDITTFPERIVPAPAEVEPTRPRRVGSRRRTGWLVAAAIAAVLAVAAVVVATTGRDRSAPPPANRTTPTPPSPTVLNRGVQCAVALPQAWKSAVTAGTSRFGSAQAFPLAVSADGRSTLVTRDFGSTRDVVLVAAGTKVRTIYRVPRPNELQVVDAYLDGDYALLDLDHLPRNSNGVIPTVRSIVLIDLRTGKATVLDGTTDRQGQVGGRTIRRAVLWHGHVYWDVGPRFTTTHPVIRDYDIASGRTRDAGHGGMGGPLLVAAGVIWGGSETAPVDVPAPMPAPVAAAAARTRQLHTDGRSYAWVTTQRRIAWWSPDAGKVVVFRPRPGAVPDVDAVAGRYILFDDQTDEHATDGVQVLDTRTGATARVSSVQPFVLSARGVVVAYRFVGGFKASAMAVVRFDTGRLPELRC